MRAPAYTQTAPAAGETAEPSPGAERRERPGHTPVAGIRGATTLLQDLGAVASGRVMSALLSFATVLFTTRMLGPAGYGTVAVVGVVSMLVFTVSSSWTGISIRRYGREDLELRGTMNRLTGNRALIVAPIAAVSVSVVLILKVAGALPSGLTWKLVAIALATALAQIITDHWICLLETSGRMKWSATWQVVSQSIYVGALVAVFVLVGHATPVLVLTFSLASAGVLVIGAAPFVWKVGVVPPAIDRQLLRRMLWLSTPMIGLMVSQYVFASIDIIALRIFSTSGNVGRYAVAYQGYTVLSAVGVSLTAVFVPLFVSLQLAGRRDLIERYLRRGMAQLMLLIAGAMGLAIPFVPLLVPIVFGHKFDRAAPALAVLLIGVTLLYATLLVSPILTLHEQTRATAVINAIAALINVVLDVLLIGVLHVWGIIAPAAATTAALLFMFLAFHFRARRILDLRESRPNLLMAAPLVAGIAPALLLPSPLGTAVGVAAVVATFAAIATWRSPFRQEDLELISKLDLPDSVKGIVANVIARFV